jgi:hypothetical protein
MTLYYSNAERTILSALNRADPVEVICWHCQRFQLIYGHSPIMVSVNINVYKLLTEEQLSSFCCLVKAFVATERNQVLLPHSTWLMLMDEDGIYKEFL